MGTSNVNNSKNNVKAIYLTGILIFIGISGCFSVLFGAWFAHAGVNLSNEVQSRLANALQYQFFHTLALFAVAVWLQTLTGKHNAAKVINLLYLSATFFIAGILLFSSVLYIKTFFDYSTIGKVVPFGGMSFALGWLCISWAGINRTVKNSSTVQDRL
ncbi:MAG: DUF423 domain-containing protein [Colwellia sp.]|nr:DUF423 domain-containing protein [Colwellia sp.]